MNTKIKLTESFITTTFCEFTLDGKKYKGNVPGIYVSTDVKELIVGDGAKYFTEYELSL